MKYNDIEALSNAERVVQFFDRLGYTINRQKFKVEELLGLKFSARLYKAFAGRHIERIVRQDGNHLEIYLLEFPYIKRKDLLQQFVNNFHYQDHCNYLFVLARKNVHGNYQHLNFLLIERDIPTYILKGQIYQQWSLPQISTALSTRYWSLEIKPSKPDESMRRPLCSFTYTETDAEQQHYKLMNIYIKEHKSTLKEIAKQQVHLFNNQGLFSNYYLLRRLPKSKRWQDSTEVSNCRRAYRDFRVYYQKAGRDYATRTGNEMFSWLFKPILQKLGFRIEALEGEGMLTYRLYSSQSITDQPQSVPLSLTKAIINQQVVTDVPSNAVKKGGSHTLVTPRLPGMEEIAQGENLLAYCLIYSWGRELDDIDEQRDSLKPNENPAARAVHLLSLQEADWVIVTNGKLWRLYTSKVQSRMSSYYEIDLADITALPHKQGQEAFQYFWFFFRSQAFNPHILNLVKSDTYDDYKAQSNTRLSSFLDQLLKDSQQHSQAVEARLKERVFANIFLHFAQGFITYGHQNNLLSTNLKALLPEERNLLLAPFFRGTLTFLYRLLVLFYAEARNLLPASVEPEYYSHSLESMKQRVATLLGWLEASRDYRCQRIYSEDKTLLYDELQTLFHIVDKGYPTLNVPQYNGGLFRTDSEPNDTTFEAETARFLASYKIPDAYLALGLDNMARDLDKELDLVQFIKDDKADTRPTLAFIDYSDLGVRQLGSIYEGLLEFTLDIPEEGIVHKQTPELFLPTDGERKNTERRRFQESIEKSKLIYSLDGSICLRQGQLERKATGSYYTPEHIVRYIVEQTIGPSLKEHLQAISQQLLAIDRQFHQQQQSISEIEQEVYEDYDRIVEAFFDFHILDPAVGSGHFLVTAIDYIAEQMVNQLADFEHGKRWHIISYELKRMRERILQEMQRQKISIDANKLDDLTLLKRCVLKSCIYGVDSNPMAVELAKVSLWLHCFIPGAPLVFLDHHIKCGDSLLGEQLQVVQAVFSKDMLTAQLDQCSTAGQIIRHANRRLDITFNEAVIARNEYHIAEKLLTPYKCLLDISFSESFGNAHARNVTMEVAEVIIQNATKKITNDLQRKIIEHGMVIARTRRFFHWELEFPDVYFVDGAKKGFDAVVGNPPYDLLIREKGGIDRSWLVNSLKIMPLYMPALGTKINLFRLFIMKGLTLVKERGYFGQIIPMSLLADQDSAQLRQFLLKNHTIVKIDAFPEKDSKERRVFRDSKLPACILVVISGSIKGRTFEITTHSGNSLDEKDGQYEASSHTIAAFGKDAHIIPLAESPMAFRLAQRLISDQRFTRATSNLHTYQGEINETTMKHFLSDDPNSGPKVLRGGNIQRYQFIDTPRQGVTKYIKEEIFKKEARGKRARHTQLLRIGFQRNEAKNTWRRLIFTPLPAPCYCFDSVSYFLIEEKNSAFLYLALFNSTLLDWLFRIISSNNHISQQEIASLPIYSMDSVKPQLERNQITATLNAYAESGQYNLVLNEVERILFQQPTATDIVCDLLASLAQKMIKLNQSKQINQQQFFSFIAEEFKLKGHIDHAYIFNLKKGKQLLEFAGDYQRDISELSDDDVWKILCENRKYFSPFGSQRERDIKAGYKQTLVNARSIRHELEATDKLIDNVIYKLYGLTPEEITVVKNSKFAH